MASILIVDDDPDMAEAVRNVLESVGYACRVAVNGHDALDEVAADMPKLVLMDMLMPIMDGWECAHQLREAYGDMLPIVIMTAAEHTDARANTVEADAVLAKPFELDDLLRTVGRYVPAPPARTPSDVPA